MPRLRSSSVFLLMLVLGPMLAVAAAPITTGIQIEGASSASSDSSAGRAWLAKTVSTPDGKEHLTIVYEREEGQRDWQPVSTISQPVTQLTHFGNQLVALLPNGQWLFVGDSTGRSLPDRQRIIAIAGDTKTLWAVGMPTTNGPTTKGPTTAAAATQPATTQPTTLPSTPTSLSLFQLAAGQWTRKANLPRPIAPDRLALGLASSLPIIAFVDAEAVHVIRLEANGKWSDLGQQPAENQRPREVLSDSGRLFVYLTASGGPDRLLVRSDHWLDPIALRSDAKLRSLGLTGSMIRYAYVDDKSIRQRSINPQKLQIDSTDEEILLPEPTSLQRIWGYLEWAMIGVVGLVVLHTYRQREAYRQLTPDWNKVQLAPFGRRIFAGMIDLMPMIVAAIYSRFYIAHVETPRDLFNVPQAFELLVWAAGIYLVHTTIIESLAGRSIGKLITRLQVVRIDGGKPAMGALAVRNLLRCVDLILLFTPIFMFYLPLRQRVGDMAATTVVVAGRDEDLAGPDA